MSVTRGNAQGPETAAAPKRAAEQAGFRGLPMHIVEHVLLKTPVAASQGTQQGRYITSMEASLEQVAVRYRASDPHVETHRVSSQLGGSSFADHFDGVTKSVDATLLVDGIRQHSKVGKLVLENRAQNVPLRADCAILANEAHDDQEGH